MSTRVDRAALATFNSGVALAAQAYYARESEPVDPGTCRGDHEYDPEPNPRAGRRPRCRACGAERARVYRARKKAAK